MEATERSGKLFGFAAEMLRLHINLSLRCDEDFEEYPVPVPYGSAQTLEYSRVTDPVSKREVLVTVRNGVLEFQIHRVVPCFCPACHREMP
jgi:hypothetical protein